MQQVVLRGRSSPAINVTSGVPQGSILGPLPFIIAIDSVSKVSMSNLGRLRLFADDICYYRPVTGDIDLTAVQHDVDLISEWVCTNNLRLNSGKTKCMLVSRKKQPLSLHIAVMGNVITQVKSFKLLGVLVSDNLSWSEHITATCRKAKRFIGFLYRHFHFANTKCLALLYTSLVRPMLDYGCCIWAPYQLKYINLLEGVQSFAARLATKRWSIDPGVLRATLGWPLLESRRRYMKVCLARRILGGESLIPPTAFTDHPSTTVRHLNSCPLFTPFVRTSYHQHSFFISVIPLWNAIPDSIITLSSHLAFKRHLRNFIAS